MGHYAKVNNGIVEQVIVAEPEFFNSFIDSKPGKWIKTSYNMLGGIYYDPETGQPHSNQEEMIAADEGRQRKNYAGIGGLYDEQRNAFMPKQPFPSWILNESSCLWESPVPHPNDGLQYMWNEEDNVWEQISEPE